MRRRSKRGPNDSESTGKIGQEIPSNQPAPLRPTYPDDSEGRAGEEAPPEKVKGRNVAGKFIGKLMSKPAPKPARRSGAEPAVAQVAQAAQVGQVARTEEQDAPAGSPEKDAAEDRSIGSHAGAGHAGAAHPASAHEHPAHDAHEHPAAQPTEAAQPDAAPGQGKLVVETQPESPSVRPPELTPAAPKSSKGCVVLAIGLPGSGKTTWFKRRGVTPLSSDMLRSILFDDIQEQRYQGLVFSTLRSLLRARLIAKMPWNYVDATNLSPHERRQWIKMARSFGYDVHAVFFDVPYAICMERNQRRERLVSEEIMQKMAERLRPPSFKEGFSKITMVRVKGEQPAKPEENGG